MFSYAKTGRFFLCLGEPTSSKITNTNNIKYNVSVSHTFFKYGRGCHARQYQKHSMLRQSRSVSLPAHAILFLLPILSAAQPHIDCPSEQRQSSSYQLEIMRVILHSCPSIGDSFPAAFLSESARKLQVIPSPRRWMKAPAHGFAQEWDNGVMYGDVVPNFRSSERVLKLQSRPFFLLELYSLHLNCFNTCLPYQSC